MGALTFDAMQGVLKGFETYFAIDRARVPRTVKCYVTTLHRFAAFLAREHGEAIDLGAVTKDQLLGFMREEAGRSRSRSPVSWNVRLAALRAWFTYLKRESLVDENLADQIERQELPAHRRLPLSFEEMLALVDAAEEHSPDRYAARNALILQVFLHCALRLSELAGLKLAQVDLDNRVFLDVVLKGGGTTASIATGSVQGSAATRASVRPTVRTYRTTPVATASA